MYNHVASRGRKALLKQIFSVFLIFTLYFNSFSTAHASAIGGWTLGGGVIQGASVVYNGSKEVILNGAKKLATGTAKITPVAADVAKLLGKGVGGLALSVAVEQLLGAVDWVLDPANNRITYTDKNVLTPADKACKEKAAKIFGPTNAWTIKAVYAASGPYKGYCVLSDNPNFNLFAAPSTDTTIPEDQKKHLPLDTVAQKVISNAEAGNADAQTVTKAAADTIVAEAETDNVKARPIINQLENTQSIQTDQTAKGDAVPKENANTENPSSSVSAPPTDLTLEFPVFCDWAPSICQAAKWVITQPQVWADAVTDSWHWTKTKYEQVTADIKEYFKDEPIENEEPEQPQEMELPQFQADAFKATPGCPADIPIHVSIGTGGNATISYEPICQFAEKWSFVAPLIGFLSGAMILIGVGRKGEDGEI